MRIASCTRSASAGATSGASLTTRETVARLTPATAATSFIVGLRLRVLTWRQPNLPGVQAVILCGLQGSGKTTLYRERFLETHARLSMDLLRTRAREAAFLRLCLETRLPFVVDNTNPTAADRARYVAPALAAGFSAVGYLVEVDFALAAGRNSGRAGVARVADAGLRDVARRFVRPAPAEGFAELWHATATPDGGWRVEPLATTPPLF